MPSITIPAPTNPFIRAVQFPVVTASVTYTNGHADELDGFFVQTGSFKLNTLGRLQVAGSQGAPPYRLAFKDLGTSDYCLKCSVVYDLSGRVGGVVVRALDADNFLFVYPVGSNTQLIHYTNGTFTTLQTIANVATDPLGGGAEFDIVIQNYQSIIVVSIDGVEVAEFSTNLYQDSTIVGVNIHEDRSPRFSNFIYSNNASLADLVLPLDTTPPVITIIDDVLNIPIGSPYVPTATAIDAVDGDITRFIETRDLFGRRTTVNTNAVGETNVLMFVVDNRGNESFAVQTIRINPLISESENRIMSNKSNINIAKSRMQLTIPNETGINNRKVRAHRFDDPSAILVDTDVEFTDGQATVEVTQSVGYPYIGSVSEVAYPQQAGMFIVGATTGNIECAANGIINGRFLLPSTGVVSIEGNLLEVNTGVCSATTDKGASFSYRNGYCVYYPANQFDHLEGTETETDTINYLMVGNVSMTLTITVTASKSVGANITTTNTFPVAHAYAEGETWEVAFTVSGRTVGSCQPRAIGTTTFIPKDRFAKNGREVWHLKIPANCTEISLDVADAWDGTISDLHVKEVIKPPTVVAPRSLQVKQVNQRQTPESAPVEGNCVIIPKLVPMFDASAGVIWTDELIGETLGSTGGRLGYRVSVKGNYKFIDCESYEKKEAINIQQGGFIQYVDGLWCEGGYPVTEAQRWDFELGITAGGTGNASNETHVINTYIDLKLPSINGQYSPPVNTDCLLLNRGDDSQRGLQTAYLYNNSYYNAGDGLVDSKITTMHHHSDFGFSLYPTRNHSESTVMHYNTRFRSYDDNPNFFQRSAGWVGNNSNRLILWNTEYNGIKIVDQDDVVTADYLDVADGFAFDNALHIAKSQPEIPDCANSAMDELECEYKLSADTTWTALPKLSVGHRGDWKFRPTLPAGTYDFRCRTILRTQQSAWVTSENVVIS